MLVVSHSCANTPLAQQLFSEISVNNGWDVDIVAPSNWKDEYGRSCELRRWPGFQGQLIGIPVFRSGNIILHSYRTSFTSLIRRLNPDVIYVHHEAYALATAQIYWANTRVSNRPIGFYSAQNIVKRYPIPFRWTERQVYRRSGFAFPCTSSVQSVLRSKGYAGSSTVLPLPIDTSVYCSGVNAEELRSKLLGDGEFLFGYVGRLVPSKGLHTLLNALKQLNDKHWRLVLVGSGAMESELRRQADTLGISQQIIFVGFVPHVEAAQYFAAFDALCLPSETQSNWCEQFGRVILEAMASGTPVVGSDSGEIPALMRATGGGLIFRERDSRDLAEKLRTLMTDAAMRKALADAGRQAVESNFSTGVVVERFSAAVRSAVLATGSHKSDANCMNDGEIINVPSRREGRELSK